MTQAERKAESIRKEVEKYRKSLERYTAILQKKAQKCESLNCNWSREEWFRNRDTIATEAQANAWFEMSVAESYVTDTRERMENAEKRLNKILPVAEMDAARAEDAAQITEMQSGFETYWNGINKIPMEVLEKMAREWERQVRERAVRDGIKVDEISSCLFSGETPNGKHFLAFINSGFTERSFHCFSLTIGGESVFTSGDFSTVYRAVRSR